VELLDSAWEADSACRQLLLDGAPFHIGEHGPASVAGLVHIYARRERLTRRKGVPSVGFSEAVERLQSCGLDDVLIGYVKDVERGWHFQLFVAADESLVVSCLGVKQPGA
jgi:hypothetical protein